MRWTNVVLVVVVLLGSVMLGAGASAQGPSPVTGQGALLDVAAMALAPDDVPASETGGSAPDATPEATSALPAATAPLGLGTVTIPDDIESITELFDQLPAAVAHESRASAPGHEETGRFVAGYGQADPDFGSPPLTLQAMNLQTGDFFPMDFTVADVVAIATDPASDYEAVAFGQDGTLAWVRAETTAGIAGNEPQPFYTLAWGEVTSPWLFTAAAFSPEGLDALVSAFVATAKTQPATPAMEATPVALRDWEYPPPLAHRPS